jgi:CubicO group peptidase (beta-lactamase class C family)
MNRGPLRLAIAFALCLAACARQNQSDGGDSAARIQRVLSGLRTPIGIKGESAVRWTLADRMQHYHVPGVSIAVIDSGRIVWAKGFGLKEAGSPDSVTPTTIFQAGSISKPTFALGVMRLVERGTLNLDEDVNVKLTSWHVPENRFTQHEKVTLRRILSHSAGLTVHGFPGYEAGAPIPTVPEILDGKKPANTAAVRVDTTPGAISRYSGGGTTIAMLLVEDVTKEPFPQFMQENVLGPAGMTHSTYEQPLPAARRLDAATGHDTAGVPIKGKYHTYPEMSAAGLWTTPSDLATLAIELQSTHLSQSAKVVTPASFAQMLTVQKAPFGIGYAIAGKGPTLEFDHDGSDEGFLSSFVAFAERGQGVAIMTNGDRGGDLMVELLTSVAAEYEWVNHQQDIRTAVAVGSQTMTSLAGRYRSTDKQQPLIATVSYEGDKLFVAAPGALDKVELVPSSDSTFFVRLGGMPVAFEHDKRGRVAAMMVAGQLRMVRATP